jgi:hypothetical protein
MKNEDIVGAALAEVLPVTDKWWFQQSHLLRLNLILLVPLLSSSVAGYDGSLMNGLQSLPQVRSISPFSEDDTNDRAVAVILRTPNRLSPWPRQCSPINRFRVDLADSGMAVR